MSSLIDIICIHASIVVFSLFVTYSIIKCSACVKVIDYCTEPDSCVDRLDDENECNNFENVEQK